jgi:hypothetical protein
MLMKRDFLLGLRLMCLLAFVPFFSWGQTQFYAKTDAREVLVNSYVQVEFVLENASGSNFTPPDFSPLKVVSGPSTSSQISIVNGKRTQKKSWGYTLLASDEGIVNIGSASIRSGRKTLNSEPLEIKIIKRDQVGGKEQTEDVFIRAELSDSIVYPGQQVLLNIVLYTNKRISGYNYLSIPTFDGFFTQEINSRQDPVRQIIGGREYQSQILRTYALFPQQMGDLYVESIQMRVGLVQRNDPFSSFFNQTRQIPLSTGDQWVKVLPLPENAPEAYSGAIGKYRFDAKLNQNRATTDDALSLKLTIEGNGLAKFIEAPDIGLKEIFEVYDPKVLEETSYVTNEDVVSKKVFEYLLVPRKEGKYDFNVSFSYFDTDSVVYKTLRSQQFYVDILPGENTLSGLTPQEILEKYQLKPMMMQTKMNQSGDYFFGSILFYLVLGVLILVFPIMYFWKQYQIKLGNIDPAEIKRKKAAKEASKRLSLAKKLMDENDHKAFYKAIADSLEKYITDKYAIQTSELSKENIRKKLIDLAVEKNLVDDYFYILKKCELALFAGVSSEANRELYQKSEELMQRIWLNLEKKA